MFPPVWLSYDGEISINGQPENLEIDPQGPWFPRFFWKCQWMMLKSSRFKRIFCFVNGFRSYMYTWYQYKHTCKTHQNVCHKGIIGRIYLGMTVLSEAEFILKDDLPIWDDLSISGIRITNSSQMVSLSQTDNLSLVYCEFGHWKLHHVTTCYCSSEKQEKHIVLTNGPPVYPRQAVKLRKEEHPAREH